jgi:autonomous glycyl radical cofactor GrcA
VLCCAGAVRVLDLLRPQQQEVIARTFHDTM